MTYLSVLSTSKLRKQMSVVKHNILANFLGQGWTGLMALVFLPVYINYLGVEAYGLIGLFTVLQTLLMLLDAGMTPTLNREMARYKSSGVNAQYIRNLLYSLEVICFCVAITVGLVVWGLSGYIVNSWLNIDKLSLDVVHQSFSIMAFIIALRFLEGIYRGSLFGLEKQVWYNSVYSLLATLRYGGAVLILEWVSTSIEAFFIWQAIISLLVVTLLSIKVHNILPKITVALKFSRESLSGVWKFASGMMGITFFTMIFLQADKLLVSKFLPLEEFGYYSLAMTAAAVLYMIVVPVTQAIYPKMVGYITVNNKRGLFSIYHKTTQLVVVLIAPAMMLLYFYGNEVIFLWSGRVDLASEVGPLLSVLALGAFLNSLSYLPYQMQIAHGWTGLVLKINIIVVMALIPVIILIIPEFGALGSAWVWVIANAVYLVALVHFMHRDFMYNEKSQWYSIDLLFPSMGALTVILLSMFAQPKELDGRLDWFVFLFCVYVITVFVAIFFAPFVRHEVSTYFYNIRSKIIK